MMERPHLTWWNKEQGDAIELVAKVVSEDPLVTGFGEGMVVVALGSKPDGSHLATWSVAINGDRTLPEVETFIAKVATYIIDEPFE